MGTLGEEIIIWTVSKLRQCWWLLNAIIAWKLTDKHICHCDSQNVEHLYLKTTISNINLSYSSMPHKYLFEPFYGEKKLGFSDLSIEVWKTTWPVYGAVFVDNVRLGSLYDSQAFNMSALKANEFSHEVFPVFYWSPGSHVHMNPGRTVTTGYIAASIRVNSWQ